MSDILHELSGLEEQIFQLKDRRKHERKSFRTVAEVHTVQDGQPQTIKVWTHDVSVSGARLVTKTQLPGDRFLLAFLMPPMTDTILECEVVKQGVEVKTLLNGTQEESLIYCVKFLRKADRSEITQPSLVDQTEIDAEEVVQKMADSAKTSHQDKKKRRYFLPLLSVIILGLHALIS